MKTSKALKKLKSKSKAGKRRLPVIKLELPPPWGMTTSDVERSKLRAGGLIPVAFAMSPPKPGVVPKGTPKHAVMANDELIIEANAWAAQQVYNNAYFNGVTWLGYTYLSELAQRPEYRRCSEVLATAMTEKFIKLQSTSDDETTSTGRITELQAEMERLDVAGTFRKLAEQDGFFGRSHLYLDTGDSDDRDELMTSIGNGRDATTKLKFKDKKNFLRALKVVEPVWCYPAKYNASDPLQPDWYNPQSWFCQGKEIHSTRLLPFVGREVPDLLKPAYSFGGLSLSQMAKPYVDNWLRTRQSVADVIWSFSVRGLKTNLAAAFGEDGPDIYNRAAVFTNMQNNQGMLMIDKDSEEFFNVVTPLGSLDALQAQSQEHMCSVIGTPVVIFLGIQPAGMNASSEGEIRTWEKWVAAFQKKLFQEKLKRVLDFIQLSLWGFIDPDIFFTFEALEALSEKELSEKRQVEMTTDTGYIEAGVLSPEDVRTRLTSDPNSPYDGLGEGIDDDDLMGPEPEDANNVDLGTMAGQLASSRRDENGSESRRPDEGSSQRDGQDGSGRASAQERVTRSRVARPKAIRPAVPKRPSAKARSGEER